MNKKQEIIFKNLDMNGEKDQERWFKIFDLLEEIYPDISKEQGDTQLSITDCYVHDFFFSADELPEGTVKRLLAEEVLKRNKGAYKGKRNKK